MAAAIAGTSYGSNPNESTYETNTNNELNEIIGDLDEDSDVDVQDLFNDSDDGEEFMGFEDPTSEVDEGNKDVDFESEPVVKKPKKTSANEKKFPPGWNDKYWKNGDGKIGGWLPDFRENSGFLIDIPDELFFLLPFYK